MAVDAVQPCVGTVFPALPNRLLRHDDRGPCLRIPARGIQPRRGAAGERDPLRCPLASPARERQAARDLGELRSSEISASPSVDLFRFGRRSISPEAVLRLLRRRRQRARLGGFAAGQPSRSGFERLRRPRGAISRDGTWERQGAPMFRYRGRAAYRPFGFRGRSTCANRNKPECAGRGAARTKTTSACAASAPRKILAGCSRSAFGIPAGAVSIMCAGADAGI